MSTVSFTGIKKVSSFGIFRVLSNVDFPKYRSFTKHTYFSIFQGQRVAIGIVIFYINGYRRFLPTHTNTFTLRIPR